jgi:hypothetical protein
MSAESATFLIRVWLPDRPGALANVAARLGALKGDVLGFEIVERRSGLAVDELVVELPATVDTATIERELCQVDDVEVEDLRQLHSSAFDPQLDALDAAAILLGAETREELADALCTHVSRAVRATWTCVLDDGRAVLAAEGDTPNDQWLSSFVNGIQPFTAGERLPELDAVWLPLPASGLALVVGRDLSIRDRERQRIAALARIADSWFRRMKSIDELQGRLLHPTNS